MHSPSLDEALVKSRVRARLLGRESSVVVSRFELLGRLGQGREGTVYEVRDRHSGALVALKQLHAAYAASGGSLKREFRALADFVHPNLVRLHELFHVGGQRFYTMELVPGVDFIAYVRPHRQAVRPERLRDALQQLLRGLEALHGAGKVHRDLKPSNVLVRADGHVVILDYGLVVDELAEDASDCHMTGFTPAYAAPEQQAGNAVAASDLYGVGVMLYEALTGQRPFAGAVDARRTRSLADYTALRPPSKLAPDVPPDLDALCIALLAPDATSRPTAALARAFCMGEASDLHPEAPARGSRKRSPPEGFVGRCALLAELHAIAGERAGTPIAVLLHGESGVGKTALMRRFCSERAANGALVLSGRCHEREHLPYKALDTIVERLVLHLNALPSAPAIALTSRQHAALARLFPVFERLRSRHIDAREPAPLGDPGEERQRAFAALRSLFRALAVEREVVLAVDDLEWGDLDSVHLLQHLLGGVEPPPILLVGVTRTAALRTSAVVLALRELAVASATLRRVEVAIGPLA